MREEVKEEDEEKVDCRDEVEVEVKEQNGKSRKKIKANTC